MNLIHAKDLPRNQPLPNLTLEEKIDIYIEEKLMSCIVTAARCGQNSVIKEWEYWMYQGSAKAMLNMLRTFNHKLNPFGYTVYFDKGDDELYDVIMVKWA